MLFHTLPGYCSQLLVLDKLYINDVDTVVANTIFSFSMPAEDVEIRASFKLKEYSIDANVHPANSGVVSGTGTYEHGEPVTLTASQESGYYFVNWKENDELISTDYTIEFIAARDRTLVANFDLIGYNIVLSAKPDKSFMAMLQGLVRWM